MPIWIGDRLIVASTVDAEYIRQDPRAILLDAGQAFGTGTHPTTQMCLLEIQAHLQAGDRAVDVGTGSGILAGAAAKLGAGRVVAIDRDVSACRMAQANVHRNGLAKVLTVSRLCRVGGTIILSGFQPPGEGLVVATLGGAVGHAVVACGKP